MTTTHTAPTTTSTRGRKAHIALWVLQVLMAFGFVMAAYHKFNQDPSQVELFGKIGFGSWFMYFIAVTELAGGVGMLIPALCGLAATCLAAQMVGAIITNFLIDEPLHALVPVAYLVPIGAIAWGRRHNTAKLLQSVTRRA